MMLYLGGWRISTDARLQQGRGFPRRPLLGSSVNRGNGAAPSARCKLLSSKAVLAFSGWHHGTVNAKERRKARAVLTRARKRGGLRKVEAGLCRARCHSRRKRFKGGVSLPQR